MSNSGVYQGYYQECWGFPGGRSGKELPANAGGVRDAGSGPGLGTCLENPLDRGAWQATIHGVTESDMTEVT